jgi:prepilin-type N-terminal cleavage/methylation domain-containing protein
LRLKGLKVKKSAFTMLELVFVIAVIGILAAAIIPRMDRDTLYEASEQLMRDIRYTQHLAMMDDVYRDDEQNWFYERWKIYLDADGYTISKGNRRTVMTVHTVIAQDPLTHSNIDGTGDYNLQSKYGIEHNLTQSLLYFDHMGRPYQIANGTPASATLNLLRTPFRIALTDGDHNSTITIQPETGYVSLAYQ